MVTPNVIAGAELTGTAATYYTCPASNRAIVKALSFLNKAATTVTVTVYLVPSGGAADDSTIIVDAQAIAPNESWQCGQALNQVLLAAGTIQALASSAAEVTIRGSVMEITVNG